MISPEYAVIIAFIVCAVGALVTLVAAQDKTAAGWVAFTFMLVASGFVLYAVGQVLLTGPGDAVTFWALPEYGFALRIYVDGLSAVFLGLIAVVALAAGFYSIGYMQHYPDYGVRRYYPNLLLFVAGMYGIVCTTDTMFFFFVFWQLMTLTSYVLVRYEHRKPEYVHAANKYLLMMQLACGLTMAGAMILSVSSVSVGNETLMKYDFDAISHHLPALYRAHSGWVTLSFALFLIGFGIKVGMWPFGRIWLPDAHPAAPSPVSALLSGVMIKTGVYGLMRYFLWLVPKEVTKDYPSERWGLVFVVLGTITLFVGTAQALKQEQTKRLLAFHSIGQMGYILLGLGACLVLIRTNMIALAAIAFYGAIFHTINHGLFKSLLFLNAGSVLYRTGTQDMNQIGGLMKYMPVTALTALVGSFAISGVPLFNGFASKWSIYVAVIQGSSIAPYLPICGAIAILTSALTLASFIKFFGASFLSRTSELVASKAKGRPTLEVGWSMRLPQIVLAVLCLLLGILPMIAYGVVDAALNSSRQGLGTMLANVPTTTQSTWTGLVVFREAALFMPVVILALLGLLFLVVRALSKLGGSTRRSVAPWLCGYARESDQTRYQAHGFYGELKRYLRWLGGKPPADLAKPRNL